MNFVNNSAIKSVKDYYKITVVSGKHFFPYFKLNNKLLYCLPIKLSDLQNYLILENVGIDNKNGYTNRQSSRLHGLFGVD